MYCTNKSNKKKKFTVIGISNLLGEPIFCIVIIEGKEKLFDIRDGIDLSKEKFGYDSDGEEYFHINLGSDKYHTGGPSCNYKGGKFHVLSNFLKVGVYQGIFSKIYLGTQMI